MVFILLVVCLVTTTTLLFYLLMIFYAKINKEHEEKKLIKILVSLIFGIIISSVIIFFIAIVFGSTFLTNFIFGFKIDWRIILFISIIIIVYSFIFDDIIVKLFQYKLGKNHLFFTLISVFRISIFYLIIQSFFNNIRKGIVFSLVLSLLFLLNDFYDLKQKNKYH